MTTRGGNSCAFTTCKNICGRMENKISFFRFPKDIERSKLWIEACGRQDLIKKTSKELYKNYRVCALHFSQEMFLNDLRNRLQPSAIPMKEHNTQEIEATPSDIIPQSNYQKPLETSYLRDERDEFILVGNKEIQTDLNLSRNLPRKKLLRKRTLLLQRKIKRLQRKKDTNRKKIKIQDCTVEQYLNLTDHFLPKPLAEFVKSQVRLNQQLKQDRKYTLDFKEFCLGMYFISAKCYNL